jgi:VPDSG-CTERM motif
MQQDKGNNMKNKFLIGSLALLTFVVFAGPAKAIVLPPGGSGPPDIFAPLPGATELAFMTSSFVTNTGLVRGTITVAVFSDPTNVFGAGDLTFVYQITNSPFPLSRDNIVRATGINFEGFMTDVGYTLLGGAIPNGHFMNGTVLPLTVDRSFFGDTVGFNFAPGFIGGLRPGTTSRALIIETNATRFTSGFFNVIDGGIASVSAYQPTVPDGGSAVALLGIALAGVEGVRRMFRARKT